MPRDLRPLLLSATVLLALPTGLALAAGDDSARVGSATGVTFSGYNTDDEGRRLWTLTADKAAPLTGPGAGKKDWSLERVRIRLFGKSPLTIAAPNAQYRGENRSANDSGPVTAEGEGVKLAGRDWFWQNGKDQVDTITINSDVRVTVTPPGATGEKASPVLITAKHLVARRDADGISLAFDGDVRLVSRMRGARSDTVMSCDKLSTRVRGSGTGIGVSTKLGRDDIERIDAEGNVRLNDARMSITGTTGVVIPKQNLYSIIGDAEFRDFSDNRVKVNGEAMHYDRTAGRVRVDPKTDAVDGRVTAELPCLDEKRRKGSDERANASGRKLEILIGPQSNTLLLTGDVRLVDPDYLGSCEKLSIETARKSGPGADFVAIDNAREPVKSVIAEDSVTLTRDGRTIRCGRAEIFPKKSQTVLTLSPRAEDPTQGSSLEATRMTLDSSDKLAQKLTAESEPGKPVKVVLPSLPKSDAGTGLPGVATGPTTVESGVLIMSRRGDIGVFEFEDKVKITGTGLDGSCERLGVEVETHGTGKGRAPDRNIRRIVASGDVKLRQDAYAAEAARAEIFPNAKLKEFSVADDNGMDGKNPFFVSLSRDETISPGLRTKVTLPSISMPGITGDAPEENKKTDTAPVPTTIESDYQELVHGSERLRAFARGDVRLAAKDLIGRSASAELLATAKPANPGEKPKFTADSIDAFVARGGVEVKFGERTAKADTLEIFPQKNTLALTGHPYLDGWTTGPGVERKILDWVREPGPDGKLGTKLHIREELRAGLPTQITRPRIILPTDGAPDLGRSLKSLDKGE
jgi:lipopolysaccharide export system protein LptA